MRGPLATCLALTVSALVAVGEPSAAAAKIAWAACTEELAGTGLECATFSVPLDHAKSGGKRIELALSRLPATGDAADQLGPLLLNPGGPGVGGRSLPLALAGVLPAGVPARYDLIGFDPRGVGASEPAITCNAPPLAAPAPDYVPTTRSRVVGDERARRAHANTLARSCGAGQRGALDHVRTADVARDLDLIRGALGAPRLNYLGFSYGTYLGQMYASLFPARVGRFVLSGTVGPTGVGYRGDLGRPATARAFETNRARFFRWAAGFHAIYGLGADAGAVRTRYADELTRLRGGAVDGVGPAEWSALFSSTARTEQIWPFIAAGWAAWNAGNTAAFSAAFSGPPPAPEVVGDGYGVACTDGRWEAPYASARAEAFGTAGSAPFSTWLFFWELTAPCLAWPVEGRPTRVGANAPQMLFINGSLDAPTTFAEALAARAAFPRSVLVGERDSLEHAGSAFAGNACVDDVVTAYLLDGVLPTRGGPNTADVTCERGPEPGLPEVLLGSAAALLPSALLLADSAPIAAAHQDLSDLLLAAQLGVPTFALP